MVFYTLPARAFSAEAYTSTLGCYKHDICVRQNFKLKKKKRKKPISAALRVVGTTIVRINNSVRTVLMDPQNTYQRRSVIEVCLKVSEALVLLQGTVRISTGIDIYYIYAKKD